MECQRRFSHCRDFGVDSVAFFLLDFRVVWMAFRAIFGMGNPMVGRFRDIFAQNRRNSNAEKEKGTIRKVSIGLLIRRSWVRVPAVS